MCSLALVLAAAVASAHCQIPCGIYDDETRVRLIEEHITTIEKSMKQITSLGSSNSNQLVRWVINKEEHAQKIQDIVTAYFMAQRIKPAAGADDPGHASYFKRLTLLHAIQVEAMKAKQTTDLKHVEKLRALTEKFRKEYFGEEGSHSH
jgi:nickel superoxide dismutase